MKKLFLSIFLFHSCIIFGMEYEENSRNDWVMIPEKSFSLPKVASKVKKQTPAKRYKWFLSNKGPKDELLLWWYRTKSNKSLDAVHFLFSSIPDKEFFLHLDGFLSSKLFQKLTVVLPKPDDQASEPFLRYRYFLENNGFLVYPKKNGVDFVKFWNEEREKLPGREE